MPAFHQGKFKPRHPEKYKGNPTNIIYRSSWELRLMSYLDKHPDVIQWASEEMFVPYRSPIDNKVHRYFPDFIIKKKNGETIMIEVKPASQVKPPTKKDKVTKRYIKEVYTFGVNQAKWEAAKQYCKNNGWKFQIITENELNL